MKRLEALVDAIAYLNEYHEPESQAYRLRNPLLLKAMEPEHLGSATDDCLRIFSCHTAGYRAGFDRLRKECRHGGGTLETLLAKHGHKADAAVNFISRSLETQEVDEYTPVRFFLE